jgi:hypothetical protein
LETLFKNIQDYVDYAEAGGITISEAHNITTDYANIFSTGNFHSDCHHWNEINPQDQTWNNFKIHFAMAYHQHKQMQGETAAASGYANVAVVQAGEAEWGGKFPNSEKEVTSPSVCELLLPLDLNTQQYGKITDHDHTLMP